MPTVKKKNGRPVIWTDERIDEMADDLLAWSEAHTSLFLSRWLSNHALHREHMAIFKEKSKKFFDAYKIALVRLEANIAEATATGEIQPGFGNFALKQKEHGGWTDRQDVVQTTTHKFDKMSDEEINERIRQLKGIA